MIVIYISATAELITILNFHLAIEFVDIYSELNMNKEYLNQEISLTKRDKYRLTTVSNPFIF